MLQKWESVQKKKIRDYSESLFPLCNTSCLPHPLFLFLSTPIIGASSLFCRIHRADTRPLYIELCNIYPSDLQTAPQRPLVLWGFNPVQTLWTSVSRGTGLQQLQPLQQQQASAALVSCAPMYCTSLSDYH